jgi:hypothetical protein
VSQVDLDLSGAPEQFPPGVESVLEAAEIRDYRDIARRSRRCGAPWRGRRASSSRRLALALARRSHLLDHLIDAVGVRRLHELGHPPLSFILTSALVAELP